MKFAIKFYYMDGETFDLEIHQDDIKEFMSCLGKGEVFFNKSRGLGIWLAIDKIRRFQMEKLDAKGNRVVECDPVVQSENEGSGGGEDSIEGKGSVCMGTPL